MLPSEPSLGLTVPAANVRGDEGRGGRPVLVVRVEEGVHLAVHTSRSTNTTGRLRLLQFTRILNKYKTSNLVPYFGKLFRKIIY